MRVLLDTNIIIDLIAQREGYQAIQKLLIAQHFGDIELWVSAKSYTDVFFILCKNIPSQALQEAFLTTLKHFQVCSVDGVAIEQAATKKWDDFEDCLISVSAENIGADFIVTRDKNGFTKSPVTCITPVGLIQELEQQGLVYEELPAY